MEKLKAFWSSLPKWQKFLVATSFLLAAKQAYKLIKPRKSLLGEIVVITGAGSGIGRLLAIKLSQSGCRLALWDVDEKNVELVAASIREDPKALYGSDCRAYQVDVTDRKKVYEVAERVKSDLGPVDILINNAGIVSGKSLLETPDERIVKLFEINAIAHFWTIKAFLGSMVQRNHGHIVTISSAAGKTGVAGLVDYCSSKFAAVGTHESLRTELRKLGKNGVSSLAVCPYYIKTGMFEGVRSYSVMLPILDPDYVVNRIVQSIRDRDTLLCMPNFVILANFVYGIVPTWVFDHIADYYGINKTMDHFVQTRPT
jgi:all-trans-retinol dehydrogenase (NAD+)